MTRLLAASPVAAPRGRVMRRQTPENKGDKHFIVLRQTLITFPLINLAEADGRPYKDWHDGRKDQIMSAIEPRHWAPDRDAIPGICYFQRKREENRGNERPLSR